MKKLTLTHAVAPSLFFATMLLASSALYQTSLAATYPLSPSSTVVGQVQIAHPLPGESLWQVGRRFDIGYYEMIEANPELPTDGILSAGTRVVIPSQYILPDAPRKGIVINLAELRLYYFPADENVVITEPVGIGKEGWETPLGEAKVIEKIKDPAWHPPARVREDAVRLGYTLPDIWPPGPDNPLGQFAMRLSWGSYLIHGTNNPAGVGKRSSAGCIRMFPEDIEALFSQVPMGTHVRVINSPNKVGWVGNQLLLESHKPMKDKGLNVEPDTISLVDRVHQVTHHDPVLIRWSIAEAVVKAQTGIPQVIGVRGS